jgi:hypothetical protein
MHYSILQGSNVEIDHCSWSLNLNRDVWVMPGDGTIRSSMDGRCMTLAGNLEVSRENRKSEAWTCVYSTLSVA